MRRAQEAAGQNRLRSERVAHTSQSLGLFTV